MVLFMSQLDKLLFFFFEAWKTVAGSRTSGGHRNLWPWVLNGECPGLCMQLLRLSLLLTVADGVFYPLPHNLLPPAPFQLSNWATASLSLSYLWKLSQVWEIRLSHLNLIWISVWRINLRHQRESKKKKNALQNKWSNDFWKHCPVISENAGSKRQSLLLLKLKRDLKETAV